MTVKTGRKNVTVMISGRGTNMAALIAASMASDYPALVTRVISNKADAPGLAVAESNAIPTAVFQRADYESNEAHEAAILEDLLVDEPDFICLAGYMRVLSSEFVRRFAGRILNIHPSLLPSFPGLDTHHRALEKGIRVHGCTVHVVTDVLDDGPILGQAAVPVLPGDDEASLAARVLAAENALYPRVLAHFAGGAIRLSGNHVVFSGSAGTVDENAVLSSVKSTG